MKLSDGIVAGLSCAEGQKDRLVFDTTSKGFGVRVQASGERGFLFRYKVAGVSRRIPLGAFGEVTTAGARKEAERLRGEVLTGRDPWAERRAGQVATITAERAARAEAKRDAFTVKSLIDSYAEKHVATLRPATRRDVLSRLRLHLASIANEPAASIGRRDAAKVMDTAIIAGETTARRVRDYARAMWGWAQRRGSLPESVPNPWTNAPAPGRDVPRDRVLSDEEIGLIWREAGKLEAPYGPLVRFLCLTMARREEATAMRWGEIAPDLSTWTQPAGRTKNGKAHVVHLSAPARAILRGLLGHHEGEPVPTLPKAEQLVFATFDKKPVTTHSWVKRRLDTSISEARAKAALDVGADRPEPMQRWVLHDFRRAGVTWLAGAGFPPHVADRLLNHVGGTIKGVAAIYQRGEFLKERERALDAWGLHLLNSVNGNSGTGKVVALRRS